MSNLQFTDSIRFRYAEPEAPSYFEYNEQRTLPRDKKSRELREFHANLKQHYLAAELEERVRKLIEANKR